MDIIKFIYYGDVNIINDLYQYWFSCYWWSIGYMDRHSCYSLDWYDPIIQLQYPIVGTGNNIELLQASISQTDWWMLIILVDDTVVGNSLFIWIFLNELSR